MSLLVYYSRKNRNCLRQNLPGLQNINIEKVVIRQRKNAFHYLCRLQPWTICLFLVLTTEKWSASTNLLRSFSLISVLLRVIRN